MTKAFVAKAVLITLIALFVSIGVLNAFPLDRDAMGLKGMVKHRILIDPEGNRTHHYFDEAGLLIRFWFEGFPDYKNKGESYAIQRVTDGQGRLVKVYATADKGKQKLLLEYVYQGDVLLKSYEYPKVLYGKAYYGPAKIETIYDAQKRPVLEVESDADGERSGEIVYEYDAAGRISYKESMILGYDFESIVATTYTYDAKGRISKESFDSSESSIERVYTYDANGRLSMRKEIDVLYNEVVNEEKYKYDSKGRLLEVTSKGAWGSGVSESYSYDMSGNVIMEFKDPSECCYEYEYY